MEEEWTELNSNIWSQVSMELTFKLQNLEPAAPL